MVVRRVLRVFWWCFAAVVVSLAVALSAARMLLPAMSEYREQIEAVAQRLVQRPVEIAELEAFIDKPIKFQVEALYTQEQFDVVLL